MLHKIIDFAVVLKDAGMKISSGDIMSLLQAVKLLGAGREEFKWALEAVLVKDAVDRDILDKFYQLYWYGAAGAMPVAEVSSYDPVNPPRLGPEEFSARLAVIKDWLRRDIMVNRTGISGTPGATRGCSSGVAGGRRRPGAGRLIEAITKGGRAALTLLAREAAEEHASCLEYDHLESLRRMKLQLGWAQGEDWLSTLDNTAEALQWQENLKLLEKLLANELDRRRWRQGGEKNRKEIAFRSDSRRQVFDRLELEQAEEVKKKLGRLGRHLATRLGYRRGPAASGQIDLRRTVRRAGSTGGIPLKLCYQHKKPTRPEIVLLCDLSGSVAPFSKFMLLLLNAMQTKFRLARSFVFIESVEEVTSLILGSHLNLSVNDLYRKTSIWQTGFSDYGEVWRQFRREYKHLLNQKTTLVVMGDARNNYKPDGRDYFGEIAGSAGRVLWLNPAPREGWGREDSIMGVYSSHCHHVFECRNLIQLERIARKIFSPSRLKPQNTILTKQ
jgi:uncharacterized protein with von Willebrand factor type A (vWA) domain